MADAWPSLTLLHLRQAFDRDVALVRRPSRDSGEDEHAALARFLVVRACGYLEQVSEESCKAYIASKSSPQVAAYGNSWFGRGANPTPANLVSLVQRFDPGWADDLQALFDADDGVLSREIYFLVDRRNKIAHGVSESTGAGKALGLAEHSQTVAEWFLVRFDPR